MNFITFILRLSYVINFRCFHWFLTVIKSKYFGQTVYSFRIFFLISLWIHYINLNKIWIDYLFCEFTMNQLSSLLMYYGSTIKPLSFSRIHYEFTICFENLQWISSLIRKFTMNPLIFSPIRNEFNFCEFTLNWNYLLREFTKWYRHRVYFEWPSRIVEK